MKQAYTPALQASSRTVVERERELPIPGRVLVEVGTRVSATSPVLAAELPGELSILRVADRMGFDPDEVEPGMKVGVGDHVAVGDCLCEIITFWGFGTERLLSPVSGTVEFFTPSNAHLGIRHESIPLEIPAYIDGVIASVREGSAVTIKTQAAFIQGIFGVGGERNGVIFVPPFDRNAAITASDIATLPTIENAIVVGGSYYRKDALDALAERNIAALVCGSIDAPTLASYVGHEIGVSITGDENVPFTLIITEGFGALPISEHIVTMVTSLVGKNASVNGTTQVRAGATRPELIVPLDEGEAASPTAESAALELGARLRIIRVPHFGEFGTVVALPSEPVIIPTGAKVRVLTAKLDSGLEVQVPRANVELVS